jgi:hypothetical protein
VEKESGSYSTLSIGPRSEKARAVLHDELNRISGLTKRARNLATVWRLIDEFDEQLAEIFLRKLAVGED